jgi:anti-sigma factor RsiW
MKVEVLYVSACPSHPAAVKLVRDVLTAQGVAADIHEVLVADEEMAHDLQFIGSPTIRINGRDVAEESQERRNFALSCRFYTGSKRLGLPPVEVIHRAVAEAWGNSYVG